MYKHYTADDWRKHLDLPENYKISGFLGFGTYQKGLYQMVKDSFERQKVNAEFKNFSDEFLEPIMEIRANGKVYWFTIAYGSALLSEYLHIACLLGSHKNLFMGTCSGLQKGASSLDFIIPNASYAEETSARGYDKSDGYQFFPNKELSEKLYNKLSKDHNVHEGKTLTYQAMLSETKEDIEKWSQQGYLAVEMEVATVFAVSRHFYVPSSAVLRIGDNLVGPDSTNREGLRASRELRHKVSEEALDIVLTELIS